MIKLQINHVFVEIAAGSTLLQAARQLGISIPTMCFLEGYPHFASCMVCVVEDKKNGSILPACSTLAVAGMDIDTDSEAVHLARKTALELLLSDHSGECLAPCQRTCPAHMNIPMMHHFIEAGQLREALMTVKQQIALPAVLGYICSAPCENGCRLRQVGGALSICALKRYVAEADLESNTPYLPPCKAPSGKKVAIIGSGPAGLSAAYYLLQEGHACTIFDKNAEPGGMLRYGVPEAELPRSVLDAEIDLIRNLGAVFEMNTALGAQITLDALQEQHDAIILAIGEINPDGMLTLPVAIAKNGIQIDKETFETNLPGVFAGGGAVHPGKMAVRSAAHGKSMALSVDQFLRYGVVSKGSDQFNLRLRKMDQQELSQYIEDQRKLHNISTGPELFAPQLGEKDPTPEAVHLEAGRCLHCGCLKTDSCKLRRYAEIYKANAQNYKGSKRQYVNTRTDHPLVIFEEGKCIQCGLCIRITEKAGETYGLTFIGRGFDIEVGVPLNESLGRGLEKTAAACVAACPTGAISLK